MLRKLSGFERALVISDQYWQPKKLLHFAQRRDGSGGCHTRGLMGNTPGML